MSEITDIKPQIKNKNRCSVYVDGQFFCGLLNETAIIHKLKIGQFVEKSFLEQIQLDNEKNHALDKALNYITRSMKTKKQIEKYLISKGYIPLVTEYVLGKLKEYNFVDDYEYAKSYANYKSNSKGKKLIEMDLRMKGAAQEDIDKALSEIGDEIESAKNVLNKYIKNKEMTKENLYKAYKYLLSKGYEYDTAKNALSSLKGGEELEDN